MLFYSGRDRILVAAACMVAAFAYPRPAMPSVPDAWGAFSGMAGACWAGDRTLSCFEWELPGEVMRQVTYAPEDGQAEVRYQLDAAGTGVDGDDGSRMHAPRPGVTVREVAHGNPARITYRHQGDKLWITIERQVGGRWAVASAEQRTRATEAQIEAAHAAVRAMRDALRNDWGVLSDLAGRHFLFQGRAAYAFHWTEFGRDLVFQAMHEDGRGDKVREISLAPEEGGLVTRVKVRYGNGGWLLRGDPEQAFPLADGGFYFSDPGVRVGLDGEGNLTLQPGKARRSTGAFEPGGPEVAVAPAPRAAFEAVAARSREAGQRMHQAAVEADRARRAAQARESNDGGGIFGALVGAAVGAYAGSAAGLDSAQTLDLMVQGAAVTSGGNPVVDAFARGLAEESAKQEVLRQGYEDAIVDGIARGSAGYARRQDSVPGNTTEAYAHASAGTQVAGKPLRFVLDAGTLNLPGDRNNATCYSNIITRPGPPGWGPDAPVQSSQQALAEIDAMKQAFIVACQRKGREVRGVNHVGWRWNKTDEDERELQNIGPEVPEDISVVLD